MTAIAGAAKVAPMANHPNRSRRSASAPSPTAAEVRAARLAAGLTQTQAAELVHASLNAWQGWEAEADAVSARSMHPAFWELFRIKVAMRNATRNAG